jgi:8-oxo-dGTP diphosphatase
MDLSYLPQSRAAPGGGDYRRSMTGPATGEHLGAGPVLAAGGIVCRASEAGGWDVAVVHRPEHLDWTLPKGKLEPGESLEQCALREVLEETGYECLLGRFVGEVEYLDRHARMKVVSYWLMQPTAGAFAPNAEVDELCWLPITDAVAALSYRHDRELLESVRAPFPASDP